MLWREKCGVLASFFPSGKGCPKSDSRNYSKIFTVPKQVSRSPPMVPYWNYIKLASPSSLPLSSSTKCHNNNISLLTDFLMLTYVRIVGHQWIANWALEEGDDDDQSESPYRIIIWIDQYHLRLVNVNSNGRRGHTRWPQQAGGRSQSLQ